MIDPEGVQRPPSMQSIRIRRAEVTDAAALAVFAARTFHETFAKDIRAEDMQAYLASSYGIEQQTSEISDANIITLLAYREETLVAYAQVRRGPPPPCVVHDHPVELRRFYVDQTEHGSGVSKELMAVVKNTALEFGAEHLWLGTWERNHRAIAFYTKIGFIDVGSTYFDVGPDRQTDRVFVVRIAKANH